MRHKLLATLGSYQYEAFSLLSVTPAKRGMSHGVYTALCSRVEELQRGCPVRVRCCLAVALLPSVSMLALFFVIFAGPAVFLPI